MASKKKKTEREDLFGCIQSALFGQD
jgi:hypothetical protein